MRKVNFLSDDGGGGWLQDLRDPNIYKTLLNRQYLYENVSEGLIVTYDLKGCGNFLRKKFSEIASIVPAGVEPPFASHSEPRAKNAFSKLTIRGTYSRIDEIVTYVDTALGWFACVADVWFSPVKSEKHYKRRFHRFDTASGFDFYSSADIDTPMSEFIGKKNLTIQKVEVFCEARHKTERWFPEKGNSPEKLYHIAPSRLTQRILRQGLVPRSSGGSPERVYLGESIEGIIDILGDKFTFDGGGGTVFEVSDLEDIELFGDPREGNTCFTYDNIPPQKLRIVGYVVDRGGKPTFKGIE